MKTECETDWYASVTSKTAGKQWFRVCGKVTKVVGMTIESHGPRASLGDICSISTASEGPCLAEVVGFRDNMLLLTPFGELRGVHPGADVMATHQSFTVACGPEILGRVLNGLGQPVDGKGPISASVQQAVDARPPGALQRIRIENALQTGVRVVDGLLTVGRGQRMGIFAGSGVGKSTFLSMIARNSDADLNVIGLVGERGREVREFIERDLGEEGMKRSVVVVATSDEPALQRIKAAYVATAIAEYFRDQGCNVNLMMDSVTRFAMAQREIGLAIGEPPTSKGYTPTVFAMLPRLLERSGSGTSGTITAFYTVLVDGDDLNDPIADAVRGILDGHIVLSRSLANAGHFPAVDVLASISRLFSTVADESHQLAARQVRAWLARFKDVEDLLRIGAYQRGSDMDTDVAIDRQPEIQDYLQQRVDEVMTFQDSVRRLNELAGAAG